METKNTTTDFIALNCTCFNVRKAARAVTQLYDTILKPTGLRGTQFTLLIALSRRDQIGISQLADVLVMERTTLTRNLRLLEKLSLVTVAEGIDRRTRAVMITVKGREKLKEAIPYWDQAQEFIAKGLGGDGVNALLVSLSKVTALTKETEV